MAYIESEKLELKEQYITEIKKEIDPRLKVLQKLLDSSEEM